MDYLDGGPGGDFMLGAQEPTSSSEAGHRHLHRRPAGTRSTRSTESGEDLRCGRGRDLARMDPEDQDRDCESFRFP